MERNIRIIDAKTIVKEGQMYLQYTIFSNGAIKDFERPYYGKDGKTDPEVETILSLAKKHITETTFVDPEVEMEEVFKEKQDDIIDDPETTLPSYPIKNLTVYQPPQGNAKVDRNYKGMIATGLVGLLLGLIIAAMFRTCNTDKLPNKGVATTDRNSIVSENTTKLSYISKNAYKQGVNDLCKYLNEELGFNYQPVDLNSFYYIANMDKFTQDTFADLVNECYLPDTDVAIIQSAFNITSDLKTKFGQSGKMAVDFDKIFYDDKNASICEDYGKDYKKMCSLSIEERPTVAQETVNKLEKFMISEPESGYNTMAVGAEFVFNRIVADTISIKAGECGIETCEAVMTEINNMTDVIKQLGGNLNCLESNNIKQKTK